MKPIKIRYKLIAYVIAGALLCSILGWLFVQRSLALYEQLIYQEAADKFLLYSERIEEKLSDIDHFTRSIVSDADIQSSLKLIKDKSDEYQQYQAISDIKEKLLTFPIQDHQVLSLTLWDETGGESTAGQTSDALEQGNRQRLIDQAADRAGASVWIGGEDNNGSFVSVRQIREVQNMNLRQLGTLAVRVSADSLVYGSNKENVHEADILIRSGDRIIFPQADSPLAANADLSEIPNRYRVIKLNSEKYFASSFTMSYTGWTFVYLVPYQSIFDNVTALKSILIVLYVIILLLLLWLGILLSRSITQPLEVLTRRMGQVEKGRFALEKADAQPPRMDEVGLLSRNFDRMTERLELLIKENYIKQIHLKEAQYEALKARLNPHFLYNTLDSINWLARKNGQKEVSGMVKSLGDLLRAAISKREFVTFKEEMELVNSYIRIQSFRFEERLQFTASIPESYGSLILPSMILQPVVENCLKYGVDEETGVCEIAIEAIRREDRLDIVVTDRGNSVRQSPQGNPGKLPEVRAGEEGIGLSSIDERLKALFGEPYGVTFSGGEATGAVVTISVPILTKEEAGKHGHL